MCKTSNWNSQRILSMFNTKIKRLKLFGVVVDIDCERQSSSSSPLYIYICKCVLLSQTLLSKIDTGFCMVKIMSLFFTSYGFAEVDKYVIKANVLCNAANNFHLIFAVFLVYELKDRKVIKWNQVSHFIWWVTWLNQLFWQRLFHNISKSMHKISWNNSCN